MADTAWPIFWPETVDPTTLEPAELARVEEYTAATMRFLTMYRVGGESITVMPCGGGCHHPVFSTFHPILLTSGAYGNCWCNSGCSCSDVEGVTLEEPVGRIDSVTIEGVALPADSYWVEDGNKLVRLDGERWPSCAGRDFTVTYLNSYEVSEQGKYAGGILAAEYLKAIQGDRKCRLPSNITALSRQGVSFELATGMFPEGTTGIMEVDAFLMQWNPYGLRTPPGVYSIDMPKQRQVTWRAP